VAQHRHMCVIHLHQGVTISGGILGRLHGNRAIGAGPVLDDERLAPVLGELVAHQTGNRLRPCPGRERRDQTYRLGGEGLGGCKNCGAGKYSRSNTQNRCAEH